MEIGNEFHFTSFTPIPATKDPPNNIRPANIDQAARLNIWGMAFKGRSPFSCPPKRSGSCCPKSSREPTKGAGLVFNVCGKEKSSGAGFTPVKICQERTRLAVIIKRPAAKRTNPRVFCMVISVPFAQCFFDSSQLFLRRSDDTIPILPLLQRKL